MYEAAEQNASDIVICRIHYFDDIHQTKIPREIFEELQYLPQKLKIILIVQIYQIIFFKYQMAGHGTSCFAQIL